MSTIRSARTRRKLPPLRLFVFAASAVLFLSMIAIIFRRHAAGTLEGRFVVLAGNALLWLVPFAGRAIFRDKIGDAMWAIFVIFAFLASFLGSVEGLYGSVWWWDLAMHTAFGYLGCFVGLFFACKLADVAKLRPLFVILFCFAVSLMFGALWEIFEFSGDQLLGNTAQGPHIPDGEGGWFIDVRDTMEDILCNTAGALVFVLHYAAHALSGRSLLLDGIKRDFAPADKAPPRRIFPRKKPTRRNCRRTPTRRNCRRTPTRRNCRRTPTRVRAANERKRRRKNADLTIQMPAMREKI